MPVVLSYEVIKICFVETFPSKLKVVEVDYESEG